MNITSRDDIMEADRYPDYILNGGGLSKRDFDEVIAYNPTQKEINENLWRKMNLDDLKLVLKIYHVISKKRSLCMIDDIEIICEYHAFKEAGF